MTDRRAGSSHASLFVCRPRQAEAGAEGYSLGSGPGRRAGVHGRRVRADAARHLPLPLRSHPLRGFARRPAGKRATSPFPLGVTSPTPSGLSALRWRWPEQARATLPEPHRVRPRGRPRSPPRSAPSRTPAAPHRTRPGDEQEHTTGSTRGRLGTPGQSQPWRPLAGMPRDFRCHLPSPGPPTPAAARGARASPTAAEPGLAPGEPSFELHPAHGEAVIRGG